MVPGEAGPPEGQNAEEPGDRVGHSEWSAVGAARGAGRGLSGVAFLPLECPGIEGTWARKRERTRQEATPGCSPSASLATLECEEPCYLLCRGRSEGLSALWWALGWQGGSEGGQGARLGLWSGKGCSRPHAGGCLGPPASHRRRVRLVAPGLSLCAPVCQQQSKRWALALKWGKVGGSSAGPGGDGRHKEGGEGPACPPRPCSLLVHEPRRPLARIWCQLMVSLAALPASWVTESQWSIQELSGFASCGCRWARAPRPECQLQYVPI